MTPFIYDVTGIDPIEAFLAVKHIPYSLLLDSADPKHPASRYSYVMCQPIETIEAKNSKISVTNWEQCLTFNGNPLEFLQSRISSWINNTQNIEGYPPFQGGAAGLFSYDLGRAIEDIPDTAGKKNNTPDMAIGIYDQVLAHDDLRKRATIFTHALNEQEAIKKRDHFIKLITQKIDAPAYQPQTTPLDWSSNFDEQSYIQAVQKVIDYIYAGDIFQANISQCFTAPRPPKESFDPFIHYCHMRKVNPAPFACYMNLGDIKISSASPEQFITIKGDNVETRPIKGTRPRSENIVQDRAYKNDLLESEKDRAENTMIVDLLRNDLSKVCIPETMSVPALCELESFAGVHHLVSTVQAKLAEGKTAMDVLCACFPGGSITGAPKIRAMEVIEEIEDLHRGGYCGSIGYIGFDGTMDTNILIRTLIYDKDTITLNSGGGIVADSDPEAEYQETLDKAHAILHSF
ncbi:MAG: aminodeoxychorismate synthase component I [Alphaproteobacteria bacterium]|nr:aminodeoxychorismate synthase component I [Alphaproteobacteria bacterium]